MSDRGYFYGKKSTANILSVKDIMQKICLSAIDVANKRKCHCPDFGISYGLRTTEEQFALFKLGRELIGDKWNITNIKKVVTYCDGYIKLSIHQIGYAIDFYAIGEDGKADYSPQSMALVATCFFEAASNLGVDIDWGGSFKSISDTGHIEVNKEGRL